MIEDHAPAASTIETDVAVIGGGPAGISLTMRLAESGLRVCLLESGGLAYEPAAQALARADVVGTPYYPLHETRVRALGGSSWSWGGICTPLDGLAFEARPWLPQAAWPFPQSTLARYLEDAFSLCGITPRQRRDVDAATAAGFEQAGLDGHLVAPVPVYFSRPTRFGPTYRERLRALPDARVILHATATHLEQRRGRITSVEARGPAGGFRVRARDYVLAAGGVENPRLLLVSGLGGVAVGRCFMEHPRVVDRYRISPGDTPLGRLIGGGAAGTLRFFRITLADELQRAEQLLNYHANIQFGYVGQLSPQWQAARRIVIATRKPWNESPFYQDAGGGRMRLRSRDLATAARRPDLAIISGLGALTERPSLRRYLEIWSAIEQVPDPDNRVELIPERDRLGVPRVRVRWTVGPTEEVTYRRALALLVAELEKLEPGLAAARLPEGDPWPSQLVGNWHHEGTTRMHDDPAHGVVDRDCRVHGVANLFVAGSSVFPSSGSTSPTVTILQLALRLADHLAARTRRAARGTTTTAAAVGAAAD